MKKKKSFFIFAAIAVFVLLALIGIRGMNHDSYFHIARIRFIAEEFKQNGLGAIPIRIYSGQNNGYGYGTPLFYGETLLYPFALLVALGFDLLSVSMLAYFVFFLLNFIIPYQVCKKFFDEDRSAFFALLYASSPYLLINVLQRGAIGEVMASAFLPIVLLFFYQILQEERFNIKNSLFLAIALTVVANVHIISTLMLIVFMFIIFVFANLKKKDINYFKNTLLSFVCASVIFLLLNASYLLPMLEQIMTYDFMMFSGSGFVTAEETLDLFTTLSSMSELLYGVFTANEVSVSTGAYYLPALLSTVFILIYRSLNKENEELKKYDYLIKILIIINVLIFWDLPWYVFSSVFGFVQFPWRLTVLSYFFIAIILTDMFFSKDINTNVHKISVGAHFGVSTLYMMFFITYIMTVCLYTAPDLNSIKAQLCRQDYIGANSYTLREETLQHEIIGYDGEYLVERDFGELYISFTDYDFSKETSLELPMIPYKGYEVLANGTDKLDYGIGPYSQMLVNIDAGYGLKNISVKYVGTKIQKISFIVTVVSWIATAIVVLKKKKKTI